MSPTASDPRAVVTDMWQTRPTRRQTDRKIAGVAAALARRYDVDPVLVRIGFVVSAFSGVGVLLYLAAWATLPPDFNDPPRGAMQTSTGTRVLVYVGLVLASVHAINRLAEGEVDFPIGLLVVGGLLYLLQVTRGEHRPEMAYAATQPGPGAPPAESAYGPPTGSPFGPPAHTGPRSRVTPVTIALAMVAAGITGAVMLGGDVGLPGPRAVVAVPLAVIGIGLLVGSFTRGGRGLVLVAVPLVLVGFAMNWAPAQHWRGAGELRVAPSSVSSVAGGYEQTFGDIELDLRNLDLTTPAPAGAATGTRPSAGVPAPTAAPTPPGAPGSTGPPTHPGAPAPTGPPTHPGAPTQPGAPAPTDAPPTPAPSPASAGADEPIRTRVTVQFGKAVVLVPENADVRVHCHAAIGEVDCLGEQGTRYGSSEGDGPSADAVVDSLGEDGVAGGRPLELDVSVGTGSVEVRRG